MRQNGEHGFLHVLLKSCGTRITFHFRGNMWVSISKKLSLYRNLEIYCCEKEMKTIRWVENLFHECVLQGWIVFQKHIVQFMNGTSYTIKIGEPNGARFGG